MRLIDADAFMDNMFRYAAPEMMWNKADIMHKIDEIPTIEERKTGEWNRRKGMYEVGFKCSECNTFSISETPYCSFCGCRMVQEGEANERA